MNFSLVGFQHGFDVGKSKSKPFYIVEVSGGNSIEFIENFLLCISTHADSIVLNNHDYLVSIFFGGHLDDRIFMGIFIGIVQKVIENMRQVKGISFYFWISKRY